MVTGIKAARRSSLGLALGRTNDKENNNDMRTSRGCGTQLSEYPESHKRDPVVDWLPFDVCNTTSANPLLTQAWCVTSLIMSLLQNNVGKYACLSAVSIC